MFNKSNYSVGTLFTLITVQGITYRYQNFFTDNEGTFLFNGQEYQYLPINYDAPQRNLEGANQDIQIIIPLLPRIIDILVINDYFRLATIEIFTITKDFPVNPVITQDKMVISSYQIKDGDESGGVALIAQAPFNAVNGEFPRLTYTSGLGAGNDLIGYLPEIPNVSVRGI